MLKMVVEFNDPKTPPVVTLTGDGWNRAKMDQVYRFGVKALKVYKKDLLLTSKRAEEGPEVAFVPETTEPKKGRK